MSDDKKLYDQARLAFQKLRLEPNDILAIKFPDDIHHAQMQKWAEGLKEFIPEGVVVLCTTDGTDIGKISEAEMNSLGWYRAEPTGKTH